jgi:hypothetical protein
MPDDEPSEPPEHGVSLSHPAPFVGTAWKVNNGGVRVKSTLWFAASVEVVCAMLVAPDFQELIGEALHAVETSTVCGPGEITTTFVVPTQPPLGMVTGPTSRLRGHLKFAGPAVDGRATGDLELVVDRFPSTFQAKVLVARDKGLTQVTYDGDITVDVPLVGPKMEKQMAESTEQLLDAHERLGERWLARHGYSLKP